MLWLILPLGLASCAEQLGAVDYFRRASTQLAQGHDLQALGDFQRALDANPKFVPAQYNLAATYLRLGDANNANEIAKTCDDSRCNEISRQSQEYASLMAEIDTDEDADCAQYAPLLAIAPKSRNVLRNRAQCYINRGSVIEAVQDLTTVAQIDVSDYTSAARAAVGSFVMMDQRQAAFALLRRCVQFDDDATPCRNAQKSLRKLEKGLLPKSKTKLKLKELISTVRQLRRDYGLECGRGSEGDAGGSLIEGARAARCASLARGQKWEQAAKICAQVRDVDPEYTPALLVQAHLELAQGNEQAALDLATQIARDQNSDPDMSQLARELHAEIRATQQQRQQQQWQRWQNQQQQPQQQQPDKDLYAVLGVDKNADKKEIRSAYRKLSKQYHPDKYRGKDMDEEAVMAKMQEINEAYEILTSDDRRQDYDSQRSGGGQFGSGNGGGPQFGGFPGGFPGGFGGFPGGSQFQHFFH